jgi:GNAT superfamily N-acetyltransferase
MQSWHSKLAESLRRWPKRTGELPTPKIVDIFEPDQPLLKAGYELYAQVFTLPEEREPLEGFETVLRLNDREDIQRDFGPLREIVTLAFNRNKVAGLANFIVYAYPGGKTAFQGSCHLNFVCVASEHRGQGLAKLLLQHLEAVANEFVREKAGADAPRLLITIEQNNPSRMSPTQLYDDEQAAGIAAGRRLAWWSNQGYRKLNFPYAQPPLSPDHQACEYIDYYGRVTGPDGAGASSIPSPLLIEHIRRFFFISVGKLGFDMEANTQWKAANANLSERPYIDFIEGE